MSLAQQLANDDPDSLARAMFEARQRDFDIATQEYQRRLANPTRDEQHGYAGNLDTPEALDQMLFAPLRQKWGMIEPAPKDAWSGPIDLPTGQVAIANKRTGDIKTTGQPAPKIPRTEQELVVWNQNDPTIQREVSALNDGITRAKNAQGVLNAFDSHPVPLQKPPYAAMFRPIYDQARNAVSAAAATAAKPQKPSVSPLQAQAMLDKGTGLFPETRGMLSNIINGATSPESVTESRAPFMADNLFSVPPAPVANTPVGIPVTPAAKVERAASPFQSADEVRAAYQAGIIDRVTAKRFLADQFGMR